MLLHLSIHNYAIVEHLDLELARGMSVITGETGAGKSIMLDALGLALGDRADSGVVRPGADKADILATFDLADIPEARTWLAERDLDNDGPCILRRVITAEGRSRGYINGTPCPLGDLKSLGELLIDIHSQHEHQSLLKTDTHRRLLDEYAGAIDLARQVQLAAKRWNQTRLELERLSNSGDEQRARHQLLSYQLEELDNLGLGENELEQLEQEHKNLTNAEALFGICRQVIDQCSESDSGNVLSALTASLNRLGAEGLGRGRQPDRQCADPGRRSRGRAQPLPRSLRRRPNAPAGPGRTPRHYLYPGPQAPRAPHRTAPPAATVDGRTGRPERQRRVDRAPGRRTGGLCPALPCASRPPSNWRWPWNWRSSAWACRAGASVSN